MGQPSMNAVTLSDVTPAQRLPALLLLAPLLIAGFFPNVILKLVRPIFAALTGQP